MSKEPIYLNRSFTVWVFGNVLGFAVLGVLLFLSLSLVSMPGIVLTILVLVSFGFAQWLALRRILLRISVLWVVTVPIGVLLASLLIKIIPDTFGLPLDDESFLVLTTWYFIIGFSIGLPQWLLFRLHFSNAWIWPLGSSIALSAGFGLVLITDLINLSEILSYIVVIITYSVFTEAILSQLPASNVHSHDHIKNAV